MSENLFSTPLTKQGGILPHQIGDIPNYGFDPSITGYIHIIIDGVSPNLIKSGYTMDKNSFPGAISTLSRGFTLPELSLNELTFNGMLNIKMPGGIQMGSELSIRFMDSQDLQLTNFFSNLFNNMRPTPIQGFDDSIHKKLSKLKGIEYELQSTYNALIFTTDPALDLVTAAVGCFGLWPKSFPKDHLNIEINNVDLYTFTQNLSCSYIYTGPELKDLAQSKLNEFRYNDTIY